MVINRRTALAGSVAVLAPRVATGQTLRSIVLGGVIAEDTVPLWFAMSAGLFRRAGLNIEFSKLASGSQATIGVGSGTCNIATTNPLSAIRALVRGVPLAIIR